jgi:hypothetical protein
MQFKLIDAFVFDSRNEDVLGIACSLVSNGKGVGREVSRSHFAFLSPVKVIQVSTTRKPSHFSIPQQLTTSLRFGEHYVAISTNRDTQDQFD